MDRTAALQAIRSARQTRGISYDDLAKAIGTKDATYLAAALHGQHRLNAEEAKKLAEAIGVDAETAMITTATTPSSAMRRRRRNVAGVTRAAGRMPGATSGTATSRARWPRW